MFRLPYTVYIIFFANQQVIKVEGKNLPSLIKPPYSLIHLSTLPLLLSCFFEYKHIGNQ
jgi:hypothetical protein